MIKPSINLQELRRRIYRKAKAEKAWRFWGLYVHVCRMETLRAAYQEAKANDGAPGLDGVSFESVEAQGVEEFLDHIQKELLTRTYKPTKNRRVEIPKGGGKTRRLGIPTIRSVRTYYYFALRLLFKWLNRRSQRRSISWARYWLVMPPWMPRARIVHNLYSQAV